METGIPLLPFAIDANLNPMPDSERLKAFENLGFGTLFTDHMAVIRWSVDAGWHDAKITARAPFAIDPASAVLHYAQEIFEGMKAYRTADDKIVLFRPDQNAKRFAQSAERMAMPVLPQALFLRAVEELVRVDRNWVPSGDSSLYLRPFMFASEAFLGVRPAREYIFSVIASPVGPYFKGGSKPIAVWTAEHYSRAASGGTGAAKCGGNYAGSLVAQAEAQRHGCDQVVFLDAAEHRYVEELGGMNIFYVMADGSLVTPPLGGTILPGITRASIMTLAAESGLKVEERRYTFAEWQDDSKSGKLKEAFACGTAAVVAGIGTVRYEGGEFQIGDGSVGPVTESLREKLVGLQRGVTADAHGWVHPVP